MYLTGGEFENVAVTESSRFRFLVLDEFAEKGGDIATGSATTKGKKRIFTRSVINLFTS